MHLNNKKEFKMRHHEFLKSLTDSDLLSVFKNALKDFFDKEGSKRFMILGREFIPWFSSRQISARAGHSNWRAWLRGNFFEESHKSNIIISETNDIYYGFADALMEMMIIQRGLSTSQFSVVNHYLKEQTVNVEWARKRRIQITQQQADSAATEPEKKQIPVENATPDPKPRIEIEIRASTTGVPEQKERDEFNLPLGRMIDAAVQKFIDRTPIIRDLEKRFYEEVAKIRPVVVRIGERPEVKVTGARHTAFATTLKLAHLERQVFIAGPMGTGKTTLAKQVSEALGVPFSHISCTVGMSESQLLGRMNAHGEYLQSDFVKLYEGGGVFLFDEIDAADANTMLVVNSALANGYLSLPNRKDKPQAIRHANFYCICAANTWGFGSNEYAGRNILDAAFLDRFVGSRIYVDYDVELERTISQDVPQVADFIWKVRENCRAARIRRAVSTRAIEAGVRSVMHGDALQDFAKRFFTGWTKEEREKAMNGVVFKNENEKAAPLAHGA